MYLESMFQIIYSLELVRYSQMFLWLFFPCCCLRFNIISSLIFIRSLRLMYMLNEIFLFHISLLVNPARSDIYFGALYSILFSYLTVSGLFLPSDHIALDLLWIYTQAVHSTVETVLFSWYVWSSDSGFVWFFPEDSPSSSVLCQSGPFHTLWGVGNNPTIKMRIYNLLFSLPWSQQSPLAAKCFVLSTLLQIRLLRSRILII